MTGGALQLGTNFNHFATTDRADRSRWLFVRVMVFVAHDLTTVGVQEATSPAPGMAGSGALFRRLPKRRGTALCARATHWPSGGFPKPMAFRFRPWPRPMARSHGCDTALGLGQDHGFHRLHISGSSRPSPQKERHTRFHVHFTQIVYARQSS